MIEIVDFQIGDEPELSKLVRMVFEEFVAPDYSAEGNDFFYSFIQAENFVSRFVSKGEIILIAKKDHKMVGMIEIRDRNQVSLLFVDKEYQGKGIAKQLFWEGIYRCKLLNGNLNKFYVHASPFSIPIYHKLGFVSSDVMQEQFGIIYLPMELTLKKS